MPISKKARVQREHKKAEAAGTRVAVNPNGTPVKAPKPTSICAFCRKELVRFFLFFLSSWTTLLTGIFLLWVLDQHRS